MKLIIDIKEGGDNLEQLERVFKSHKCGEELCNLRDSLELVKADEKVIKLFEKALSAKYKEENLIDALTIREAFTLDQWMESSYMPVGFPLELAYTLSEQLGLSFKAPLPKGDQAEWKNLFKR